MWKYLLVALVFIGGCTGQVETETSIGEHRSALTSVSPQAVADARLQATTAALDKINALKAIAQVADTPQAVLDQRAVDVASLYADMQTTNGSPSSTAAHELPPSNIETVPSVAVQASYLKLAANYDQSIPTDVQALLKIKGGMYK
jgi:hypothetical protein